MWGPWLRKDDGGAIFTAEAVLASMLVLSVVACLSLTTTGVTDSTDDLDIMSGDLLDLLEHRENTLAHPNLGIALSSPDAWEWQRDTLEADVKSMMPAGVQYHLSTPYGTIGERPPGGTPVSVRPFQTYRYDSGTIVECSLVLWRP
jgi:hypothetical protein